MDSASIIEQLKIEMVIKAQEHNFNLIHPEVVEISQRLDFYINNYMRHKLVNTYSLNQAVWNFYFNFF